MSTKMSANLAKAKTQLILDQPFFASILMTMPMIEDSRIPTMATNGDSIRYNPAFVETLTKDEIVFVLAHETLHCVFQHMHRRNKRDMRKWNVAADYVINDILSRDLKDHMGRPIKAPEGALIDPALVARGNGTTEGVYNCLPEPKQGEQGGEPGQYPGAGEPGGALDSVEDASSDPAEMAAKEAEMKVKVIQAANAAKMAGKLSAGLQRLVSEIAKPTVNWKDVLRRFLSERAKTDLTYAKPKRRFLAEDIMLPGLTGERLGKIVVAIDCSGSIDDKALAEFEAEISAIASDTCPAAIEAVYFDSKVLKQTTFTADDTIKLTPVGGGGTAFSPVFKYIAERDLDPVACVVLTDLECDDYGPAPSYPVLWVTNGRDSGNPFGEVVRMKARNI